MRQRASWTYPPQVFTSVHLFNKIVRSGFTINSPLFQNNRVKIHPREKKVGWRFTKLICFFLGQDSLSNKENNKTIKRTFVQDSPCFKYYQVKIHHVQKWTRFRFTNPEMCIPQDSKSKRRRIFDDPWRGGVQGAHWRLHKLFQAKSDTVETQKM